MSGQTYTISQAGAGSSLGATSGALQFLYQVGGPSPPPQTLTVYSSGAPLNFNASASSSGNWLFVSPGSGATSTILSVFVNPASLAPGTYTGLVTVTAAGSSNGSQTKMVTLLVSAGPAVTITPGSLSFSHQQGGNDRSVE